MTSITAQAIAALDGERLWADLHELAQFGARDDGGVARLTLDDNDIQARLWLAEQARELGGDMQVDPLGNVFVRLPGSAPDLLPVTTGSHLDSQPTGGKYDGAYGVLAGMAALRAIRETGIQPRHSLEVVSWTNWAGCTATLTPLSRIDPVTFPTGVTHAIAEAAGELGQCAPRLVSGAFHDAIHLAGHCPTGMIFIPCQGGISHHPSECINAHDATEGARLLTATLCRLACSP